MSEYTVDLDSPTTYARGDPARMLQQIREFDRQADDAWAIVRQASLPDQYRGCRSILVLGMGGSAIGGDLARTLVSRYGEVPMLVWRDYGVPSFVDETTLVIASSYSGETEETLSGTEAALNRGARVVAVTTGGRLAAMGQEKGFPVVQFHYPAQPRAALGYSLVLIVGALVKLGYLPANALALDDIRNVVRAQKAIMDVEVPTDGNPAKQLARQLVGKLPVVYGGDVTAEVARRWKGQLNENSKNWAFFEQFPELNHNAVMGYEFPRELAPCMTVIMLESTLSHPRVNLRYRITEEILLARGIPVHRVRATGATELGHMASLIVYGDYVSYYLAILNRVDPSSIEVINYLKQRLAESSGA